MHITAISNTSATLASEARLILGNAVDCAYYAAMATSLIGLVGGVALDPISHYTGAVVALRALWNGVRR